MPRLTGRDYKGNRRSSLDLRRHREFLYGAGAGVLLASVAFLYVGAKPHPGLSAGPSVDHPVVFAAATGAEPGAAGSHETLSFPDMLAKSQVAVPPKDKHAKREPPVGHRAADAAR